jgi:3-methylcrotonyl-CoA carboxylase alpha subunit
MEDESGAIHRLNAGTAPTGRGVVTPTEVHVFAGGEDYVFTRVNPLSGSSSEAANDHHLRAPMPGRVLAVPVKAGERVERGAPLVVLEAMKMEHTLRAPGAGRVASLRCVVGDQVSEGAELVEWEPEA